MRRLALLLTIAACDPAPTFREAPDVPWPAVEIEGPLKSPASLVAVLEDCFAIADFALQPGFDYEDEIADGDDWQPARLCVDWSAHIDVADCVRKRLLDLGGTPNG